ncbi:MAG: CAP domain-containing protein [Silicimonas sp.]|nr:CAP domain-containing protein [Silicimonas sp.]
MNLTAMFIGAALIFSLPSAADACTRTVSKKAAQTIVPAGRINQSLLDSAIRNEVNYHRCRAGLQKVSSAGNGLVKQAAKHSTWMARSQQLTHRSTVPGLATLKQRVKKAGVKFRTGSENIGMVHRYQIDNRRFKILNASSCQFATYEGQALPAHSYASLARHAVNLWMQSPGHRKNILDRRVTRMSAAVAFDPKAQYCGRYWLTQNFVG